MNGLQPIMIFYCFNSYKNILRDGKIYFALIVSEKSLMVNSLCSGIVKSQDLMAVGKTEDREGAEEGWTLQRHTCRQVLLSGVYHQLVVEWQIHQWIDPLFGSEPPWYDYFPKASHLNTELETGIKHMSFPRTFRVQTTKMTLPLMFQDAKLLGNWLCSERLQISSSISMWFFSRTLTFLISL